MRKGLRTTRPERDAVDRRKPDTRSNEIDLYVRTYYSLLRSSGEVRVRSFEEAHTYSNASLHSEARSPTPDVAAFAYAAARLPEALYGVDRIVLGQSDEVFESFGFDVTSWSLVRTRGRRRHLRGDGNGTLAAYIASASDIDDLIPMVTAYQIEWNKMHSLLQAGATGTELGSVLQLDEAGVARLREAFGDDPDGTLRALETLELDLSIRLLSGSFSEYQEAAQVWWRDVAAAYPRSPRQAPTYFVSSNTHALSNLIGGYAIHHADELGAEGTDCANHLYHLLRRRVEAEPATLEAVGKWESRSGITSVDNRTHVEVEAKVIDLSQIDPERLDPRVRVPGIERLAQSDARILNIDYPLGMAAYHILSRVGQGIASLLGIYIMGKAATLNGQVGDVLISRVVHDEHSDNTYIFPNAFAVEDVEPFLQHGSVLDNQKAVTCRGPFLQNPEYISVFYKEGYSVLEMEAGPYLSGIYELVDPRRHPTNEIVSYGGRIPFEFGILHYASDTPYSRRQTLLSKSLGSFGLDSTYACAVAITRRILAREVARIAS